MEQADRARRAAEQELNDANESMSDLKVQNQSIAANKRRMEAELDNLKVSFSLTNVPKILASQLNCLSASCSKTRTR